jgi:signal transduction histidine kinase
LLLMQHRLRNEGERREIQVIKNYGEIPLVTCYASQMNQVFLNLLHNAIDAVEVKMARIFDRAYEPKIWIQTTVSEKNSVLIHVKDNGIGIAKDLQAHIFEPFFTTKSVSRGAGLGLSTSYEIVVEKHRGNLTFQTVPEEGTEFVVEIPLGAIKNE